ncbi:hypothetical protein [Nocardia sp. BMG51109]|uniref:hypothetical protein n=1 Tax=Nocardia sp. BMG51109 TaxID=1056816 RepID=UPI0004B48C95|nr:hypothetical protein [Nocardia sp. BMG51109]
MNETERHIQLSAIHVRWSADERTFIARSDQFPAVAYRHDSSLAAMNGLIDAIHEHLGAVTSVPGGDAEREH